LCLDRGGSGAIRKVSGRASEDDLNTRRRKVQPARLRSQACRKPEIFANAQTGNLELIDTAPAGERPSLDICDAQTKRAQNWRGEADIVPAPVNANLSLGSSIDRKRDTCRGAQAIGVRKDAD